ncbi:hypothetical protein EV401DRAFT_436063 [Pisolithus croceorrhizus]|nr:hypothetical protein EV401DRAFT_436063 [Pisolithus croceorrhizus]
MQTMNLTHIDVSVQACDSSSAHPAPSCVSSVQGSEGSVDPVGQQSLTREPMCPSEGLRSADEAATALSTVASGPLVIPLLSQQPSPFAPAPGAAKPTLPAAPSIPVESDDPSSLDPRTRSTPVDVAPVTVAVGASISQPVFGGGALAGGSSTVGATASVLPSAFHPSSMDHSPNRVVDSSILSDTSVQSPECLNRLQPQPALPYNPSASCDPQSAALRRIGSSISTSPPAAELPSTTAGSMQESINAASSSLRPLDSQTGGEDEDVVCPGSNLTSFVPALPTETTLAASTQGTTGTGSCGNVCLKEEGLTDAAQGHDDARNVQCNHGAGASTSEPVVVSEPPHDGQSEGTVDIVPSHQLLPSSTNGGCESTLSDNQHMQEEEDVLQALVPTTPATEATSPASIPSLILPSTTVSRCSSVVPRGGAITDFSQVEKLQVPSALLADDPVLDKAIFLDPHSMVQSAQANEKLSSSTSLSSTSSIRVPLSTPPSPLTSIMSSAEPADLGSLQDDAPFANYILKESRGLTKRSSGKYGGPSASLSELMKLARRKSQPLSVRGLKVSKERKRKRGDPEDIQEAHVTEGSHLSSSERGVSRGMEAGTINSTDRGGASSGPGRNAISLTEHDKELTSQRPSPLKIVIPAKKRIRTGEPPVTELEVSKMPTEDAYQETSSNGGCSRGVRQRHIVLSGKVVRMDADLSWDDGPEAGGSRPFVRKKGHRDFLEGNPI